MKKIIACIGILLITFLVGCSKNKNNGKSRIKNYSSYDGIGVYNSAKKKSVNKNIKMIKIEGEDEQVKVDLKLCGLNGDSRKELSFSGFNPFEGKSIARCSFFDNFAFFMVSKADIYVSETEYDSYVSEKTNATILSKQSSNDELYVLSLKTGFFYDFGDTFEEIDLSNKRTEGSNSIVINTKKNGNMAYYLLKEVDEDIVLKRLPSIEEITFMDKYDNIYYGARYIKHDDDTLTLQNIEISGTIGLTLTKQCFCIPTNYSYKTQDFPTVYDNGFDVTDGRDGAELYLLNDQCIGVKYDINDKSELLVNIAYCSISNYLNNDKCTFLVDDVLYTPFGVYEVVYDTNTVLGYKLKTINANLQMDLIEPYNPYKCAANKNGSIAIFYDLDIIVYDKSFIQELVDGYKNSRENGSGYTFREYCCDHVKKLDVDGIRMNSLTNRLVGKEIRIYFEGYKDSKLCSGYIDENFNIIYDGLGNKNYNEIIVIHKTN